MNSELISREQRQYFILMNKACAYATQTNKPNRPRKRSTYEEHDRRKMERASNKYHLIRMENTAPLGGFPKQWLPLYNDLCKGGQGIKVLPFVNKKIRDYSADLAYSFLLKCAISSYQVADNVICYEEKKGSIDVEMEKIYRGQISDRVESVEASIARNVYELRKDDNKIYYTYVGKMDQFPMLLKNRDSDTLLRPVLIDAVGVTISYHHNQNAFMCNYNRREYDPDKKLVMKPILEVALYYLFSGHKVIVAVPDYYKPENWEHDEHRVDNIVAFEHLIGTGIVEFLGEHTYDVWVACLLSKVDSHEFHFVSNHGFLERAKRNYEHTQPNTKGENVIRPVDRVTTADFILSRRALSICHDYAFKMGSNESLPLSDYGSSVRQERKGDKCYVWIQEAMLLSYHNDTTVDFGVRIENQLTFTEQYRQIRALDSLIDFGCKFQRAYQILRYIGDEYLKKQHLFDVVLD